MTTSIGKILFIDDKYSDVKKAVEKLVEKGMTVQYWNGKGDFPVSIFNVRVVIIDLDLSGIGTRAAGPEFYLSAAQVLNKIPGPFVAIIMALDYNTDDPSSLNSYYKEKFPESPLCGVVAKNGLTKDEVDEDPTTLKKIIETTISEDKILGLVLAWEGVMDKAQDKAFSDIITKEIRCTVLSLVKSLCRDFGEESAAREFVITMMRLVSRRTFEPKEFQDLDTLTRELNLINIDDPDKYPCEEDLQMHNKLMFFEPVSTEMVWTGDIFKTSGLPRFDDYAIVLTPVCDLVNNKTAKVLMCIGFPVDEAFFKDSEYPPYKIDNGVKDIELQAKNRDKTANFIKNKYMLGKPRLPDSLFFLWNFEDEAKILGICFNFNNIKTLSAIEINESKWKRIRRLDSPFIQELLERYGRFASRVGTPEINLSPIKLRENFLNQNPELRKEKDTAK